MTGAFLSYLTLLVTLFSKFQAKGLEVSLYKTLLHKCILFIIILLEITLGSLQHYMYNLFSKMFKT